MDYHSDRFEDFSLLVFKEDQLVALLPANRVGKEFFSHQGLTFGGLILPFKTSKEEVFKITEYILDYLKESQISSITIKTIPEIYFKESSHEMESYLLNSQGKILFSNKVLAIDYGKPLTIHKTKLKRFRNNKYDFSIEETQDFKSFWEKVLVPCLQSKHNSKPVHTLEEIKLLASRFPDRIKQFNLYLEDEILAGITLFENETVVKSQYGAATEKGEKVRALDYLFLHLIFKYQDEDKHFFSMGTVSIDNDLGYSPGMLKQKEELGCSIFHQNIIKRDLV